MNSNQTRNDVRERFDRYVPLPRALAISENGTEAASRQPQLIVAVQFRFLPGQEKEYLTKGVPCALA